ncbi:DNA-binding CsgD family transcriptional regulator [Rhodoligotrophos appendicifer]|uniref:helix-turn-helix transcriptional regulator n=1 Tax=Rhodoligotrophos appendicifer TaxID=987056 RepID=UPI0011852D6F|nr:hypothetical protein [Rhodoligotrophos appendicifer]
MIRVIPLVGRANDIFTRARAVISVVNIDTEIEFDPVIVKEVLGLTLSEAKLACRIAEGKSLENFASTEGLSLETVRSRIKEIFGKTDLRRQTDLALLVCKIGSRKL